MITVVSSTSASASDGGCHHALVRLMAFVKKTRRIAGVDHVCTRRHLIFVHQVRKDPMGDTGGDARRCVVARDEMQQDLPNDVDMPLHISVEHFLDGQ